MTTTRPEDERGEGVSVSDAGFLGQFGPETDPSLVVIRGVATLVDKPPGETEFVLHEYVDPDALDLLVQSARRQDTDLAVEFTIEEYSVVVRSNGDVAIAV